MVDKRHLLGKPALIRKKKTGSKTCTRISHYWPSKEMGSNSVFHSNDLYQLHPLIKSLTVQTEVSQSSFLLRDVEVRYVPSDKVKYDFCNSQNCK